MATLVNSFILFFLLFPFPCFSSSCETTLPCNHSIQIRPPFFIHNPDPGSDPNCGKFLVLCDGGMPYIYIYYSVAIPLENITYDPNTIRVRDRGLSDSLQRSNCSNIYFDFPSPVDNFNSKIYSSLSTSFASIRCISSNLIQSTPNIFGKDYNLNYSTIKYEENSLLKSCSSHNSSPSFELTLSFNYVTRDLSLISASYSNHLSAKPGCFDNSTLVLACDPQCKG